MCKQSEWYYFLKTLTPKRLVNNILLRISYHISFVFKTAIVWGQPEALSIEPTTICNLKCPECPVGNDSLKRKKESLSFENFKTIIDKTYKTTNYLNLYFQGEPLLNSDIFDMITYAKRKRIFVVTSTNGHFLSEDNAHKTITSGLDKIIISLDGTDQNTYEKYRVNGHLETVLAGIKSLVKLKQAMKCKTPLVVIQFLVFKHNEHQISEIKKIVSELDDVRLELKSPQLYNFENKQSLLPENKKFTRYIQKEGKLIINSKLPNHCWRMWHSAVITVDGSMVPCCFDKDANHCMGNIFIKNSKHIWKSKQYRDFRNELLTNRAHIEMCQNCSEDLRLKQ